MNTRTCDWLCDAWTVICKELKDLTHAAAANPTMRLLWLLLAAVFGVALPWQMGRDWLEHPQMLLVWLLLPIPLVVAAVAESIAGEREHHTLEPLLPTRLPVRPILTGKSIAATAFGWLGSAILMLVGLMVVNLTASSAPLLYPPALAGASLGLGLLVAFFTACVGISVSLHAATVRRAYMSVSMMLLVIAFALVGGVALLLHLSLAFLPNLARGLPILPTPLTVAPVLMLADAALFILANRQFCRTRLLAD